MRFDLTDLRLFENIVEAGSITRGAAQTHMTLASASQRVLGMEADLGTPLLLRSRQGVQPTEAGRTLAHHARLVLQQMACLRGELGGKGLSQVVCIVRFSHPRDAPEMERRDRSRKACSPDNAACEGFFGRLKTEQFYPRDWQATTIKQFVEAIDFYIRWRIKKGEKAALSRAKRTS